MKANSLFKLRSLVALVFFTSLCAGATGEQTDDSTPPAKAAPAKTVYSTDSGTNDALTACHEQNGYGAGSCDAVVAELATINGQSSTDKCSQAQSALTSNFSNMLSQQQSLISAQKEQIQEANTQQNAILEAQKAARDASRVYSSAVTDIQTGLASQIAKQQSDTAKALLSIKEKVSELAAELTAANDAQRAAASAIAKAQTKRETTCRAAAEKAGNDKQTELKAKKAEEDKAIAAGTLKRNGSGTSQAGYNNRTEAKREADIQAEYMTAYKNCLSGSTGAGSAANEAITDAQSDYEDAQSHYKEVVAQINDKKALLTQEAAQAQADGNTSIATLQASAQAALAKASNQYDSSVDEANTKVQEATNSIDSMKSVNQQTLTLAASASQFASQQFNQSMGNVQVCAGDKKAAAKAPTPSGTTPTAKPSSASDSNKSTKAAN